MPTPAGYPPHPPPHQHRADTAHGLTLRCRVITRVNPALWAVSAAVFGFNRTHPALRPRRATPRVEDIHSSHLNTGGERVGGSSRYAVGECIKSVTALAAIGLAGRVLLQRVFQVHSCHIKRPLRATLVQKKTNEQTRLVNRVETPRVNPRVNPTGFASFDCVLLSGEVFDRDGWKAAYTYRGGGGLPGTQIEQEHRRGGLTRRPSRSPPCSRRPYINRVNP